MDLCMAGGPDPDLADQIASPGLGMTGHNLARSFYAQLRVTPTPSPPAPPFLKVGPRSD
jgi:hypothetical protein